jgi:hypothetical protein
MPQKTGVNSVLRLLHSVIMGDTADVEDPEDGDSMYLRNVGNIARNHIM